MQAINDLKDLLIYFVQSLSAAEAQIEAAMPAIIEKAKHASLKNALQHHLSLSPLHKKRLQTIAGLIANEDQIISSKNNADAVKGLISEANDLLQMQLAAEVTDAALIAALQKIEHYEISCYGTAAAFAAQLKLNEAEALLRETLMEEYDADDLLTSLATAAFNKEALHEPVNNDEPNSEVRNDVTSSDTSERSQKVTITERTIQSPGGRSGTSHRAYANGESRGH